MSEQPWISDEAQQRALTNTRNLAELLCWLEYGRTSGYRAARCEQAQEHHWADLLRAILSAPENPHA
jgi:hypothetical protein